MGAFDGQIDRPFERLSDRIGGGILGQLLITASQNVVVPDSASFVFAEVQAKGGSVLRGGAYRVSAGGAGTDAIFAVKPGETIAVSLGYASDAAEASTIAYDAVTITANSPAASQSDRQSAVPGKYPGTAAIAGVGVPGKGTGRLAGAVEGAPGYGGGVKNTFDAEYLKGGRPAACLTFFASYDDALTFAKAVYGGQWAP